VLGVHDTNRLRDVRTPTLRQQSSLSMTVLNKIVGNTYAKASKVPQKTYNLSL
jgi:hypothetical protein